MKKKLLALAASLLMVGLLAPTAQANHDTVTSAYGTGFCNDLGSTFEAVKHGTTSDDVVTKPHMTQKTWCYDFRNGDDDYTILDNSPIGDISLMGGGNDFVLSYNNWGGTIDGEGGNDDIQDVAESTDTWNITYGGTGNDTIDGGDGEDDVFGDQWCEENNMWGFWGFYGPNGEFDETVDDRPCATNGGSDQIFGRQGDDWLWESNSDHYSDGQVDYIYGGGGNDYCAVGPEDVYQGCETVHLLTQGPPA